MELMADLFGKYQGEKIKVFTNGGQILNGVIEAVYGDYFTIISVTRLYFVPYTGISTFHLIPEVDSQQATISEIKNESQAGRTPRQAKERKQAKPRAR